MRHAVSSGPRSGRGARPTPSGPGRPRWALLSSRAVAAVAALLGSAGLVGIAVATPEPTHPAQIVTDLGRGVPGGRLGPATWGAGVGALFLSAGLGWAAARRLRRI